MESISKEQGIHYKFSFIRLINVFSLIPYIRSWSSSLAFLKSSAPSMNHLPSAGRRPSLFLHGKSKARWMNISQTFPLLSLAYTLIYIPICLSPPLFHLSSCVTLQSSSLDFIFFHSQLNLAFSLILPCSHNPSSIFSAFLYWLLPLNKETCCSVSNLLKNKEETRGGRGRQRKEKPSLD